MIRPSPPFLSFVANARFFLPHFIDASGAEAINGRQQLYWIKRNMNETKPEKANNLRCIYGAPKTEAET
jgi:hypothetical protein